MLISFVDEVHFSLNLIENTLNNNEFALSEDAQTFEYRSTYFAFLLLIVEMLSPDF